jgi:hypothetical protein
MLRAAILVNRTASQKKSTTPLVVPNKTPFYSSNFTSGNKSRDFQKVKGIKRTKHSE